MPPNSSNCPPVANEAKCTLETRGIRKQYPGVLALDDVSVRFEGGQVSALLGKNGAGKSTLVKILAGTLQPTAGELLVSGKPVRFGSAMDAFKQGIATVYQELSLVPGLTVAGKPLFFSVRTTTSASVFPTAITCQ